MKRVFNKKVLIIEDDDRLRFNMKKMVKSLGHEVVKAYEDASPFYDEILTTIPEVDLILLDINLPGDFNGVDFATKIKERFDTPILYVTGNVEEETFLKAAESNLYGYLPKPFTKVQLDFAMKICLLRYYFEIEAAEKHKRIKEKEKLIQIGEFAGGFVHDLNNFNSIIMSSFHMIRRVSDHKDDGEYPRISDFAQKGEIGSERIKQLSTRYRKIILNRDNDKKFDRVDLMALSKDVIRFFDHKLTKEDIELKLDIEENLYVQSCEITLLQSLVNLISNAIYEIVDKDCKERWIKLSIKSAEGGVALEVSDSGPGIAAEIIDEIFTMGFSTKDQDENQGSGVGLSFVRNSIETELKGSIGLVADSGNTTFRIFIPKTISA